MSRFTVTAAFTVEVPNGTTADLVGNEARTLLRNTIDRRTYDRYDGVSASLDSVAVEVAPEPEPTVTLTESELQATIAECVAQALAERDASNAAA